MTYYTQLKGLFLKIAIFTVVFSVSSVSNISGRTCDSTQCCNHIEFKKLCVCALYAKCMASDNIYGGTVCADTLQADTACFNNVSVNNSVCFNEVNATTANFDTVNANNICVSEQLQVNTASVCNADRATVVFNANTLYTLGATINWDTVVDDPNEDVSLVPNTYYTAPVSGYYIVTFQADVAQLQPADGNPILGSPVGNPQILVNGVVHRDTYFPFLTFVPSQKSNLTSLIKLEAGDVVTSVYNVLTVDPVGGFIPLNGTIMLLGNGSDESLSTFKIILLASDCMPMPCNPVIPCVPTPCDVTCTPCDTSCPPCQAR